MRAIKCLVVLLAMSLFSALMAEDICVVDVTERVAAMVKDNQLTISGRVALCDRDPAPGIRKKLRIDYRIENETKTKVIYEGDKLNIVSPAGVPLKIVKAIFGDFPSRLIDVSETVKDAIADGKLKMKVDGQKLVGNSDPAPGAVKELRLYYTVGGKMCSFRSKQNTEITLPAPADGPGEMVLTTAFYGDPATTVKDYISPVILAVPVPPPPAASFTLSADAVYQWSVRVGDDPYRRAYLWIPDNCPRVRGVIIGVQHLMERQIFADPVIRRTASAEGLAMVWISPGSDMKTATTKYPNKMQKFTPPKEACDEVQQILTSLAKESGYSEIEYAPLIATSHAGATPFAWGMQYHFDAGRMAAVFPCKGSFPGHLRSGIPVFYLHSEYNEVGDRWGDTLVKDRGEVLRLRREADDRLIGEFVDIGSGHFDWNPASAAVVAKFLQKVSHYRIPAEAPVNGPVALTAIDPRSGVLIAADKLGTPEGKPLPCSLFKGDVTRALWYFDAEMAQTVNDYMVAGLAGKPQFVTILNKGKFVRDFFKSGSITFSPEMLPDGVTFRLKAAFLDRSPTENLYRGKELGHGSGPILFQVGSGAIRQVGPDTFRIWMTRGGLVQMGQPWEPWIIAYHPGDAGYRRAVRPVHPSGLGTVNKDGKPQMIDFAAISDQKNGVAELKLQATADSGLPVQFYVISGPVQIDPEDNIRLRFTAIPPRSRFPVKVIIGAYQWGNPKGDKIQNAVPVFREFLINK